MLYQLLYLSVLPQKGKQQTTAFRYLLNVFFILKASRNVLYFSHESEKNQVGIVIVIRNSMKVRYIRKGEYQGSDLNIGKIYVVIGIEADGYRIINDVQMPYLYNPNQFEIVEPERPNFWVTEFGEEGEEYSYPSQWNSPGFFEDFHDGVSKVINQFWAECETLYGIGKNV